MLAAVDGDLAATDWWMDVDGGLMLTGSGEVQGEWKNGRKAKGKSGGRKGTDREE